MIHHITGMHSSQARAGARWRVLTICSSFALLAGCDGCLATDDCSGFLHQVERFISVNDARDTIRVGDTVTFSIFLPWMVTTKFSYELQDSFSFDLRDTPNPNWNGAGWFPQYAPLGSGTNIDNPLRTGFLGFVLNQGGDGWVNIPGDSTARGLEGELSVIFRAPGRYYIVFSSARVDPDSPNGGDIDNRTEYDAYNLTRTDGCRERIAIYNRATNYDINDAAVNAQNASSEAQMRVRRGVNDLEADYYVLVTE